MYTKNQQQLNNLKKKIITHKKGLLILTGILITALIIFAVVLYFNKPSKTDSKYFIISEEGTIALNSDYKEKGVFADELPETIVIPKRVKGITVKKIARGMFSGCKNLKTVEFPDTITMTEIPSSCFSGCNKLENVIIPKKIIENIYTVEENAFYNCYNLKSINLPKIERIENYAFAHCFSLMDLTIPNSVGNSALIQLTSLEEITLVVDNIYEFIDNMVYMTNTQMLRGSKIKQITLKNLPVDDTTVITDAVQYIYLLSAWNGFNDCLEEIRIDRKIYENLNNTVIEIDNFKVKFVPFDE